MGPREMYVVNARQGPSAVLSLQPNFVYTLKKVIVTFNGSWTVLFCFNYLSFWFWVHIHMYFKASVYFLENYAKWVISVFPLFTF